jgi:NADH-quinone oxidoreductase subunit L
MFHLSTHAAFKALLFLAAGAVMHALHGETDMRKMGGLARGLPRTAAAFGVGALALAGIPPLPGFFSKEEILGEVFAAGHVWLWAVGLVTAGLTAFYITRAYVLTFGGRGEGAGDPGGSRGAAPSPAAAAPHDPPAVMWWPTAALIVLAVIGGAVGAIVLHVPEHVPLARWLRPVVEAGVPRAAAAPEMPGGPAVWLAVLGVVFSVAGMVLGWLAYARGLFHRRPRMLETLLAHQFYIEDFYNAAVVSPSRAAAAWAGRFDRSVIDGAVVGIGEGLGRAGEALRRLQSGYLRQYAAIMLIGALVILAYWLWR